MKIETFTKGNEILERLKYLYNLRNNYEEGQQKPPTYDGDTPVETEETIPNWKVEFLTGTGNCKGNLKNFPELTKKVLRLYYMEIKAEIAKLEKEFEEL